eukprot:7278310-Pyramimonas_sp.AAC.1
MCKSVPPGQFATRDMQTIRTPTTGDRLQGARTENIFTTTQFGLRRRRGAPVAMHAVRGRIDMSYVERD